MNRHAMASARHASVYATQKTRAATVQSRTQPRYGARAIPTATASAIPAYGASRRMGARYTDWAGMP